MGTLKLAIFRFDKKFHARVKMSNEDNLNGIISQTLLDTYIRKGIHSFLTSREWKTGICRNNAKAGREERQGKSYFVLDRLAS